MDFFWSTKKTQHDTSADKTNRGAVVGGKQLDGFVEILKRAAVEAGVPEECIYTKNNYVPGYFRASKDWDFMIVSPGNKLLVVVELKSQVGSYGNNFNNRAEEAIGSAVDLWTAFKKNAFPDQQAPWVGYVMVVGSDEGSNTPVRNYEPHYNVMPEFRNASYIDRYRILCKKLILERHYTATALLWTSGEKSYGDVAEDISIKSFINSLSGYLHGAVDAFK